MHAVMNTDFGIRVVDADEPSGAGGTAVGRFRGDLRHRCQLGGRGHQRIHLWPRVRRGRRQRHRLFRRTDRLRRKMRGMPERSHPAMRRTRQHHPGDFQRRRHGRNGCGPGVFVAGPARATGREGCLPDRARRDRLAWGAPRTGAAGKALSRGGRWLDRAAGAAAARHQGFDVDVDARHDHQLAAAERLGSGRPSGDYDVVLDAAGSESSMARSAEAARPGGRVGPPESGLALQATAAR